MESYARSIEKVKLFITTTFKKALEGFRKVYDKVIDTAKKISNYSKEKFEELKTIYHEIKYATGKKVIEITKATVLKISEGCKRLFKQSAQMIAGKTAEVSKKIEERIAKAIKSLILVIKDRMYDAIRRQIIVLKESFRQWENQASEFLTETGDKIAKNVLDEVLSESPVGEIVEGYVQAKQKGIGGIAKDIVEAGKKGLDEIVEKGKKGFEGIVEKGKKGFEGIVEKGKKGFDGIVEKGKKGLEEISKGIGGKGKKTIHEIPVLEGLAEGMVGAGKKTLYKFPKLGEIGEARNKRLVGIAKDKADPFISGIVSLVGK